MMRRVVGVLGLALLGGTLALSQSGPVGTLGVAVTFTSAPPSLTSEVALGLSFGRAEVLSRTQLSLTGLVAQHLVVGIGLDGIGLKTGMRFNPCFSQYWFEVRGGCCPLELGGLFLVENLAPACQTPNYTIGIVLDLGVAWRPGFFARSLTGFGVTNLYGLIDPDPATWLVAVPGVWFEEELLHLGFTSTCFRADALVLFDPWGLAWFELGASYLYPNPEAELGARIRILGTFALDWAKLFLGVRVPPVAVRLVTEFDLGGFVAQEVWVEVFFSWVRIYSRTRFDFGGFLQATVGVEVKF
ncbi:MAG: hypothetical protein N2320_03775 [Candidatus Bipolaricaulota bacterium]|nr:hypothetical protein [Candidatus Bipolaricaulota bacterium]